MNKEFYQKHSHRDSSLETLIDFINDGASIGHGLDMIEFINYEDEFLETNIDKIFQLYTIDDITQFFLRVGSDDASRIITKEIKNNTATYIPIKSALVESNKDIIGLLPLIIGTELILPLDKIDRELKKLDTNQVVDFRTFKQFIAAQLYYLLKDEKYERTYKIKEKNTINSIKDVFPFISVWVWSKSLSEYNNGQYLDTIMNITPFVTNLNTSVGANGGSFNITIAPVTGEYIKNEGWIIDRNIKVSGNSFISESGFYKSQKEDSPLRSDLYFNKIIQENDVIFIRFEKLDLEENRDRFDKTFFIDKKELAGNIYDMIGLVDNNTISVDGTRGDVMLNVGGRDLVKLFIEDGVYFFPYDYIGSGIFANEDIGDRLERYDGQLKSRFQLGFKTIDNTLKFILNALSTIKISSDSLFDSYKDSLDISDLKRKDRRSAKFFTNREQLLELQKEVESQNNEVVKIKELIERSRAEENIIEKQNIDSIYSTLYDFITKLKEKGLVIEVENKLTGWGSGLTYDTEAISKNNLPKTLANKFYLDKMYWIDQSGNILTDTERKTFLDKVAKQIEGVKVLQNDVIMGRNLDTDRREKIKDAQLKEKFDVSWEEYKLSAVKRINEPIQDNLTVEEALGESERQIEQRLKYKLLQGEYEGLESKGKQIYAATLPKNFKDINSYGKEVLERIYTLIKRIADYNKKPAEDVSKPTRGIWQIIKLVVDDNIRTRRIVDSSIGNEHGSLINALRKVAQEPFVELLFDTYGDQYYITVRKPPFDKKGMISMIEDTDVLVSKNQTPPDSTRVFEEEVGKKSAEGLTQKQSIVIDIEDSDVISDSLNYGITNQIYSWYRLTPQNLISGQASDMAFAYLKAIYLKEYADIWGSKPLDISTNYIPYFPVVDKNNKLPTSYFIKQGIIDLKYMIESNAYNPFVRSGTITTIGNRMYKKGTFVRLKSTNEIYYIDAVSNSYSINIGSITRTTTLQVSRGMIEQYIKGVEINGINHSYFNLVNTEIDDTKFEQQDQGYDNFNKMLASWNVNRDVFYFFLKQKQFAHIANFINIPQVDIDI